MPQVDVLNAENKIVDKVDLAPWWEESVHHGLIHQAVVAARAGARRGTSSTKTRADVRGGGRKPFRQKGTGRARQGTTRAPQMKGGGAVFGPQPRDYSKPLNKRMSRKALRGALAYKMANEALVILDQVTFTSPKTRELVDIMDRLDVVSALLVVDDLSDDLLRASGNLSWVKVAPFNQVNIYDVLVYDKLIITKAALEALEGAVAP